MFGGGIDRRPQTITTIEIQGQQLYEWERAHKKRPPQGHGCCDITAE